MRKTKWKVVTKDRKSARTEDPRYIRKYLKNTTVKAQEGSLGLMVFETKKQAKNFSIRLSESRVLEVMPIGRPKRPTVLAHRDHFNLFYKHKRRFTIKKIIEQLQTSMGGRLDYEVNNHFIMLWPVPEGTVCYPSVKVLE